MTEKYFRLLLKNVRRDQEDLLVAQCFEAGAAGFEEILGFAQNPEDYSVASEAAETFSCSVYFTHHPGLDFLEVLQKQFPNLILDLLQENSKDWMEEWKKGFQPFRFVEDIWIVPHWCQAPPEAKGVVWMEPGMAFGTGTHETTRLAAKLMAPAVRERKAPRVLDVGTGTGLLALLARQLGASQVLATDIDPEAVRVAGENLELNRATGIEVSGDSLTEISTPFDIVVANIIDGVLVVLQKDLKRLVAPGGALILSGIIDERRAGFLERFSFQDFKLVGQMQDSEWHGFSLVRE